MKFFVAGFVVDKQGLKGFFYHSRQDIYSKSHNVLTTNRNELE
ncbi:Uncharacterized protein APZ42_006510 [Daphnia magna]|uniref:Uncharacterized protein n=1 Tax=Daphnia magna TaxID=35525 RepID=A0A164FV20_9CRUS|nr:Uncharacterized protein APZ42_006510 [Daphnia magna]